MTMTDCSAVREIPGFPGYWVSENGVVYSNRSGRWHRINPYKKDHDLKISLCRGGVAFQRMLGRTILVAFRGECLPGEVCIHKNGDRTDCRLENLRWGGRSEAIRLAINARGEDGRHARCGEANHAAKLRASDVVEIRSAHRTGSTLASLARRFGVSYQTVAFIVAGTTWKHLLIDSDFAVPSGGAT